KAVRLFLNGQLDEALTLLSEERLKNEIRQASLALERVMRSYLLRGQLFALRFQFAEAASAYDEAVKLEPGDFDAWFAYDYFHQRQNRFVNAEKGYGQALAIARNATDRSKMAVVLNNL